MGSEMCIRDSNYTDDSVGIKQLKATLDDSRITGSLELVGVGQKLALDIDKIDLDRYLAAPVQAGDTTTRAVDEFEIPAQSLRDLNVNGTLKIGELTMSGIESNNVRVTLAANNGAVRVHPVSAKLYGGSYTGDIRIDASGEVPVMSLNEQFNNVDFGALSLALADSQQLTGRVTGSLVMTATGHNLSLIHI